MMCPCGTRIVEGQHGGAGIVTGVSIEYIHLSGYMANQAEHVMPGTLKVTVLFAARA
jgi:hypothetical protein